MLGDLLAQLTDETVAVGDAAATRRSGAVGDGAHESRRRGHRSRILRDANRAELRGDRLR